MRTIWAIAIKDLRLLMADKVGCFFVFFWPLLFASFFGFVLAGFQGGETKPLPIFVHDADKSDASHDFITTLTTHDSLEVAAAEDPNAAVQSVLRGRRVAAVLIPTGFGHNAERLFWGDPAHVSVIVDPSKHMEAAMVEGLVQGLLFERVGSVFSGGDAMRKQLDLGRTTIADSNDISTVDRDMFMAFFNAAEGMLDKFGNLPTDAPTTASADEAADGNGGWRPFRVDVYDARTYAKESAAADSTSPPTTTTGDPPPAKRKLNIFALVFPQAIVWGVMACAASFACMMVVEHTRGTLPRLLAAPVSRWQILLGKGGACFLAAVGICIVLLIIARFVFNVTPQSLPLLALAVICNAIAIVGVMLLFSVCGKTEAAVGAISWAIVVIMAMFGGGMIPLSQLSGSFEKISYISIFRWAILALDGAIWRGYTITQMLLPCGVLLAIGLAGILIGSAIFRLSTPR